VIKKKEKRAKEKRSSTIKGQASSTISPPLFSKLGTGCEQLSTDTGGVK
jgi:hypothetical protein